MPSISNVCSIARFPAFPFSRKLLHKQDQRLCFCINGFLYGASFLMHSCPRTPRTFRAILKLLYFCWCVFLLKTHMQSVSPRVMKSDPISEYVSVAFRGPFIAWKVHNEVLQKYTKSKNSTICGTKSEWLKHQEQKTLTVLKNLSMPVPEDTWEKRGFQVTQNWCRQKGW